VARWMHWARVVTAAVLGLSAIGAALATVEGKLQPLFGGPAAAVLAAAAVVFTQLEKLLNWIQESQQAEERRLNELRHLLATPYPLRLKDSHSRDLGVRTPKLPDDSLTVAGQEGAPYVGRTADAQLRRCLINRRPFVLVVGESRAGKSRTAFESVLSPEVELTDHVVLVPAKFNIRADALGRIFELANPKELGQAPAVLWLDDLHRFLDAGALTPTLLNSWRQQVPPNVMIVATIRSEQYQRWMYQQTGTSKEAQTSGVIDQARAVLGDASKVELASRLVGEKEIAAANEQYGRRDWLHLGLGEFLALGPELVDKLKTASDPDAALFCAVADWERMGLTRPMPRTDLAALWRIYMDKYPRLASSDESFSQALERATAPIPDSDSALLTLIDDGYDADDYVVAYRDGQGDSGPHRAPVPHEAWQWVINAVSPEELLTVGIASWTREEREVALAAWDRAAATATEDLVAAMALANKATGLDQLQRHEEELATYGETISRFGHSLEPDMRALVAEALVNKSKTLGQLERPEEALAPADEVVRRFSNATDLSLREAVAKALGNKASALIDLERPEEALAPADEVVRRFSDASELGLREAVALALVNKATALDKMKRHDEELATREELVRRFNDATELSLREIVAQALVDKAIILGQLDRPEEALAPADEVVRRFGDATELSLREAVVRALVNKAIALDRMKRHDEELATYGELVRRVGDTTELSLREIVAQALVNEAITLGQLERPEEALAPADEVVRRFGDATELSLREAVAQALVNKGVALGQLDRPHDELATYEEVLRRFEEAPEPEIQAVVNDARHALSS
jgi:tetratricopeptide (TPR) repeat protein